MSSSEPRTSKSWTWAEGAVDPDREHIELRYGDASQATYDEWTPVALVGRPKRRTFPVRWLLPAVDVEIVSEVRRELDFYLVQHPKDFPATGHPWGYAIYHCGTGANVYSRVHWSYFQVGRRGERYASALVRLSADQAVQFFGGRNMTGDKLFDTLRPGDFLRLAHRRGKVHRAYGDEHTGTMRICRPSMLEGTGGASRQWEKATASEYSDDPCDTCR